MKNRNIFTYEFWENITQKLRWNEKINGSICSTKGRISRFPFFIYSMMLLIIRSFLIALTYNLANIHHSNAYIGLLIPGILIIYMEYTLTIKRLHDLNLSGWYVFLPILFVVLTKNDNFSILGNVSLIAWFFMLFLIAGNKKKNKFNIPIKK